MLKAKITKTEHDALSEPLRKEYKADGDAFVLETEGLVSKADLEAANAKVVEFRENNRALNAKATELDTLREKYKDVDTEKYKTMTAEIEELKKKGINKPDDVATQISKAVTDAVKPLADKLASEETARKAGELELQKTRLRTQLTTAALDSKAKKEAVDHVVDRAEQVFELDAVGGVKARDGFFSADKPAEPISVTEWMTAAAKSKLNYAFEPSTGGGAGGGKGGGPPESAAKQITSRDPAELGKSIEALAKGEAELA